MGRIVPFLCILACSAFAADGPTTTTLYKSIGPDGKVVYSDHPPVEGQSAKELTFKNLPASPLSAATLAFIEQLKKSSAARAAVVPSSGAVLFSAAWCGYCKKAKAYLARKGVPYREMDVDTNEGAVAFAQAGGKGGVPLLLANGQTVAGFSPAAYDALFTAHK